LAGWVDYVGEDGSESSVAALYRYVPNRGDAWTYTLTSLDRFFGAASRSAADPYSSSGSAALRRMAGDYLQVAARLGVVTGQMHLALASSTRDPAFAPEPISND